MRKKLIALIMSTVMLCGIQIVPAFALDPSNAAVRYDSVNGNVEYLDSQLQPACCGDQRRTLP